MKRYIIAFAVILLTSLIVFATPAGAVTAEEYLNNVVLRENLYNTEFNKAYLNNSRSEEEVNPQSGQLTLRQTDLSLPGKNGLNLDITRIYTSGRASLYQMGFYSDADFVYNDATQWNFWSFDEARYGLGAGMRFSFPSLEISKGTGSSNKTYYMYLHKESGDVYRLVGQENSRYALQGYELDDIEIYQSSEMPPNYSRITGGYYPKGIALNTGYIMKEKNGTKTYFSKLNATTKEGLRTEAGLIMAIVDSYGNEIDFGYQEHTNAAGKYYLISNIVDTADRVVTLDYKNYSLQGAAVSVSATGQQIIYKLGRLSASNGTSGINGYRYKMTDVYRPDIHASISSGFPSNIEGNKMYSFEYPTFTPASGHEQQNNGSELTGAFTFLNKFNRFAFRYSSGDPVKCAWDNVIGLADYDKGTRKLFTYKTEIELLGKTGSIEKSYISKISDGITDIEYKYDKYKNTSDSTKYPLLYPNLDFEEYDKDSEDIPFTRRMSADLLQNNTCWTHISNAGINGSPGIRGITNGANAGNSYYLETILYEPGMITFDAKANNNNNMTLSVVSGTKILGSVKLTSAWEQYSINITPGKYYIILSVTGTPSTYIYVDNVSIDIISSSEIKRNIGNEKYVTSRYEYNPKHQLVATYENGDDHYIGTQRTYDQYNMLSKITTTSYKYVDGATTMPITTSQTYEYDVYGNLLSYQGPEAPNLKYEYQYADSTKFYKMTSRTVKDGNDIKQRTEYVINSDGGKITSETEKSYPDVGDMSKYLATDIEYDAFGNIKKKHVYSYPSNSDRVETNYEYGLFTGYTGNGLYLTREYTANGSQIIADKKYDYSLATGVLTAETLYNNSTDSLSGAGFSTTYSYDSKRRLDQITYPDNSVKKHSYEVTYALKENIGTTAIPRYKVVPGRYDIRINGSAQKEDITYSYDNHGNIVQLKQNNAGPSASSELMLKEYMYDPKGRVIQETDGRGNCTKYSYMSDGQLSSKQLFDGATPKESMNIVYGDDDNNRMFADRTITDIKKIAVVSYEYAILKNDGTVWRVNNMDGGIIKPVQMTELENITDICAGDNHFLALKQDNQGKATVWSWGRNDYGQLGRGTVSTTTDPLPVAQVLGFTGMATDISASGNVSGVIADNKLWRWGERGTEPASSKPAQEVASIFDAKKLVLSGTQASFYNGGNMYFFSYINTKNELRTSPSTGSAIPYNIIDAVAGYSHIIYLSSNGELGHKEVYTDSNAQNRWHHSTSNNSIQGIGNIAIKAIAASQNNSYVVDTSGYVWVWSNTLPVPEKRFADEVQGGYAKKISSLRNIDRIYAGNGYVFAVDMSGKTWKLDHPNAIPQLLVLADDTKTVTPSATQRITITDYNNNVTTRDYDVAGRILNSSVSPDNNVFYATEYEYDDFSNIKTIKDPYGNTTTYEYDDLNRLTSQTDAINNTTVYSYDSTSKLKAVTYRGYQEPQQDWATVEYKYDLAGRLTNQVVGKAIGINNKFSYTSYEYDCANNMRSQTLGHVENGNDSIDAKVSYSYNNRNRLWKKTDLIDDSTSDLRIAYTYYSYDYAGNSTLERTYADTVNLAENEWNTISGSPNNHLANASYIQNQSVYDNLGHKTLETTSAYYEGIACGTLKHGYVYDNNGNITDVHAYYGGGANDYRISRNYYDYANRLTEKRDPFGDGTKYRRTAYQYDNNGNLIGKILCTNEVTLDMPFLTTETYQTVAYDIKESYKYDGLNLLTGKTYNISSENPNGNTTRVVYDANGNKIAEVDARYATANMTDADVLAESGIHYTYDELNRLSTVLIHSKESSDMLVEKREYDMRGNVTKLMSGEGYADSETGSLMKYDAVNNLVSYTSASVAKKDANNISRSMTYDGAGRMLTQTDYKNATEKYTANYKYYKNGQLKQVTYPDQNLTESYECDNTGKLRVAFTNRNGDTTTNYNTLFGTPWKTEYPDGNHETTDYQWYLGLALVVTDLKERKRRREYDEANNPVIEYAMYDIDNDYSYWSVMEYTYDKWSNVKTTETFDVRININEDAFNYAVFNSVRWDANHVKSMNDRTEYEYDYAMRLKTVTGPNGMFVNTVYDEAGNTAAIKTKVNDGADPNAIDDDYFDVVRYKYDPVGRCIEETVLVESAHLTADVNAPADPEYPSRRQLAAKYSYYSDSSIHTLTDPHGNVSTYKYDLDGKLILIELPENNTTEYTYDDYRGNLTKQKNALGGELEYEYDSMGRVTEKREKAVDSTSEDLIWSYSYDYMGNLNAEQTPSLHDLGGHITYEYDKFNRRIAVYNAKNELLEAVKYDKTGNIVRKLNGLNYKKMQALAGTSLTPVQALDMPEDNFIGDIFVYDRLDRIKMSASAPTVDALGNVKTDRLATSYEYNVFGQITSQSYVRKNVNGTEETITTAFEYYPSGELKTVNNPNKEQYEGHIEYNYDKKGRITKQKVRQSETVSTTVEYVYTGTDNIYTQTDADGLITYKYDEAGNVVSVTDKRNNQTTYTYDGNNRIKTATTPIDAGVRNTTAYEYDAAGNVKSVSSGGDGVTPRITTYAYRPDGRVLGVTTNSGTQTTYRYDANGNLYEQWTLREKGTQSMPDKYDVIRYEYDEYDRITAEIKLLDAGIMYEAGNLAAITEGGHVQSKIGYKYNILGIKTDDIMPKSYLDQENEEHVKMYTVHYDYDELSRLTYVTNSYVDQGIVTPVGTRYDYDNVGNQTSITVGITKDDGGNTTSYTYDELNRVETVTNANNVVTNAYKYDFVGNITENKCVTAIGTATWKYEYDEMNRLCITRNPDDRVVSRNVYDANGNIEKTIDGEGYQSGMYGTVYTYNAANQLKTITPPGRGTTTYEYNAFGECTNIHSPMDMHVAYDYDLAGRLKSVTNALGEVTSYEYDLTGNQTSMVDGNGQTTHYAYGSFGMPVSVTDAKERTQSCKYDISGNIVQSIDREGNSVAYKYSNRGELLSKTANATNESIIYAYDKMGNRTSMVETKDAIVTGTTEYKYDNLYRMTDVSGSSGAINYAYNNADQLTKMTYAGTTINYGYDKNGRLRTVSGAGVNVEYEYYANDLLKKVNNIANGAVQEYKYYEDGAVHTLTTSTGTITYTYDAAGRVTTKTDGNSQTPTKYEYDTLSRITKVSEPGRTSEYSYDHAGNRKSLTEVYSSAKTYSHKATNTNHPYNIKVTDYEYSTTNELETVSESMYNEDMLKLMRVATYSYTDSGDMYSSVTAVMLPSDSSAAAVGFAAANDTSIEVTLNTYDGFHRMSKTAVTKDGETKTSEYTYNGDGMRVSKTLTSGDPATTKTTTYLYSDQYVVAQSTDNQTDRYVRGIHYIAKIGASNDIHYYQYNAHGDVVSVLDSAGTVKNRYNYDVFGKATLSVCEVANSIMFAGEFYDEDAGLYYNRARWYDPETGRFTQEDTYRGDPFNAGSINLYSYCYNSPLMYTDPSGHEPLQTWQESQANINSAFNAWKGGYISQEAYERCVAVNRQASTVGSAAYAQGSGDSNVSKEGHHTMVDPNADENGNRFNVYIDIYPELVDSYLAAGWAMGEDTFTMVSPESDYEIIEDIKAVNVQSHLGDGLVMSYDPVVMADPHPDENGQRFNVYIVPAGRVRELKKDYGLVLGTELFTMVDPYTDEWGNRFTIKEGIQAQDVQGWMNSHGWVMGTDKFTMVDPNADEWGNRFTIKEGIQAQDVKDWMDSKGWVMGMDRFIMVDPYNNYEIKEGIQAQDVKDWMDSNGWIMGYDPVIVVNPNYEENGRRFNVYETQAWYVQELMGAGFVLGTEMFTMVDPHNGYVIQPGIQAQDVQSWMHGSGWIMGYDKVSVYSKMQGKYVTVRGDGAAAFIKEDARRYRNYLIQQQQKALAAQAAMNAIKGLANGIFAVAHVIKTAVNTVNCVANGVAALYSGLMGSVTPKVLQVGGTGPAPVAASSGKQFAGAGIINTDASSVPILDLWALRVSAMGSNTTSTGSPSHFYANGGSVTNNLEYESIQGQAGINAGVYVELSGNVGGNSGVAISGGYGGHGGTLSVQIDSQLMLSIGGTYDYTTASSGNSQTTGSNGYSLDIHAPTAAVVAVMICFPPSIPALVPLTPVLTR